MSQLPTNRSTSNTVQEHVDDHNEIHRLHNVFDGTQPSDFEHVSNKGATNGYASLSSGYVPTAQLATGTANSTTYLRGDQTWATAAGGGFDGWTITAAAGASQTIAGDGANLKRVQFTLDQATCAITVALASNDQQCDVLLIQGSGGNKQVTFSGVTSWLTSTGAAPTAISTTAGAIDRFYFERVNGVTYGYYTSEPATATVPWLIPLRGYAYSASSVAFAAPTVSSLYIGNYYQDFTGTQNDWLAWDVVVAPGTWEIEAVYRKKSDSGILSFQINDAEVATIDTYNASTTESNIATTSTFTVSAVGKVRLKCKIANKNASSTGYNARISDLTLIRTA